MEHSTAAYSSGTTIDSFKKGVREFFRSNFVRFFNYYDYYDYY